MVQYVKTGPMPTVTPGTTGAGATPSMSNNGISVITNTTTEVFTLAPPETGCRKTIVITSLTTTVLPVIRTSSSGGGITFVGASTGYNLLTVAAIRSTVAATVIELIGLSSTQWLVAGVCPGSSTATINQAVTLSSG
jgi:hypothetical protein